MVFSPLFLSSCCVLLLPWRASISGSVCLLFPFLPFSSLFAFVSATFSHFLRFNGSATSSTAKFKFVNDLLFLSPYCSVPASIVSPFRGGFFRFSVSCCPLLLCVSTYLSLFQIRFIFSSFSSLLYFVWFC